MMRGWRNSGIRLEKNAVSKIQNYVETVFPIFICCLFSDSWITNIKMTDKTRTDNVMRKEKNLLRTYKTNSVP